MRTTEVRFHVGTDFLDNLGRRLRNPKATDIVRTALALLDWATEEVEKGRGIYSATEQGDNVQRLVMPELLYIRSSPDKTLAASAGD